MLGRNMPFDHFRLFAGLFDRGNPFAISESLLGLLSLSPTIVYSTQVVERGALQRACAEKVGEVFVEDLSCSMLRYSVTKGP